MTLREAADVLGVSERSIARACDAGAPSLRVLTTRRVHRPFIEAVLAAMALGPVDLVEFARSWAARALAGVSTDG